MKNADVVATCSTLTKVQVFADAKAKQSFMLSILRSSDDQTLITQYMDDIKHAVNIFGVSDCINNLVHPLNPIPQVQAQIGMRQALVQTEARVLAKVGAAQVIPKQVNH